MPEVGKPSSGSRGAGKTREITDWNHDTELLKQHADSQWHRDAAATAVMARQAESGKSVLELQCSVLHNRLLNVGREIKMFYGLLRSANFLAKNKIPHTTVYPHLVNLQVANDDHLLEQHIKQNPSNAQYTSKFSVTMLIEAIDTWLERSC